MTKEEIIRNFQMVRQQTEQLCQPLIIEDYVIQSMDDVSPPKWHLAHTTWFFETFLLVAHLASYKLFHPSFHYLFNSYYQSIGKPYPRAKRGLLSRPGTEEIYSYRKYVDSHILTLIDEASESEFTQIKSLITLGLQHEQQHQELLLMDIKHNFSLDPDYPCYNLSHSLRNNVHRDLEITRPTIKVLGGVVEIGYNNSEFCFDNELPRHKKILSSYLLARQLVTNGEYLEFIEDGGYRNPQWWLADGWDYLVTHQWHAPLYWQKINNKWHIFTLSGIEKLNPTEPVCHISYYEADAYARWLGYRLPYEEEWEHFVVNSKIPSDGGNFMESGVFHPQASLGLNNPEQFFGDLWEWTSSSYSPYPGYKSLEGTLGEYNGKFMSNQMVLRGGSCVTPKSHIRASYRNFFQPEKRWQFSGIRLASDI